MTSDDSVEISEADRIAELTQRLAAIVESSDDAIISKDLNGVIATWNTGAERLFGYKAEEVIGKPITILIPEDLQDEEPAILERLRRGERIDHYETVRKRKDGRLINISLTVSPVKNANGRIVGASKIARDITERKLADERIRLLAREVDHRAKNLLALVQATVHLTRADTTEELKAAIEGRIRAIANAHTLIAQSRWAGANFHTLVVEELAPFGRQPEARAEIEGPDLILDPGMAQSMAIALHELATNAAKYGALSTPNGRIRVEWTVSPSARFDFRWSERGGPRVAPPRRRGVGTRVIEQVIEGQMKGELRVAWDPEGLVCEITVPNIHSAVAL